MDNNYGSDGAVLAPLERWRAEIIVSFCRDRAKGAWEDVANGTRPDSVLLLSRWRLACVLILLGLRLLPYSTKARGPFFLPLFSRVCGRGVLFHYLSFVPVAVRAEYIVIYFYRVFRLG